MSVWDYLDSSKSAFDTWWKDTGQHMTVPNPDYRVRSEPRDIAYEAWLAATVMSRKYACDKPVEPGELTFANGRMVWIRFDEHENPYLWVE